MKKSTEDPSPSEGQHNARELRQELRTMGYRLTGNEAYEDLVNMLREELNRQWFQNARRGTVIRRRKAAANSA